MASPLSKSNGCDWQNDDGIRYLHSHKLAQNNNDKNGDLRDTVEFVVLQSLQKHPLDLDSVVSKLRFC